MIASPVSEAHCFSQPWPVRTFRQWEATTCSSQFASVIARFISSLLTVSFCDRLFLSQMLTFVLEDKIMASPSASGSRLWPRPQPWPQTFWPRPGLDVRCPAAKKRRPVRLTTTGHHTMQQLCLIWYILSISLSLVPTVASTSRNWPWPRDFGVFTKL